MKLEGSKTPKAPAPEGQADRFYLSRPERRKLQALQRRSAYLRELAAMMNASLSHFERREAAAQEWAVNYIRDAEIEIIRLRAEVKRLEADGKQS